MEKKLSVAVSGPHTSVAEIGLIDGNELHGTINAMIYFDDDVFLRVREQVKTTGDPNGTPSRLEYAYQLVVKGIPMARWHFEPRFVDPAMQYHFDDELGGVRHVPDQHRTLKEIVNICWANIDDLKHQIESGEIG